MLAEFDLRFDSTQEQYARVLATFAALPTGESLRIIADHEPRPLRCRFGELYADNYVWTQRHLGENFWEATIRRITHQAKPLDESEAVLACSPLFADVSVNARRALAKVAIQRVVSAGAAIVEQGDSWPYLGVVASGGITGIVNTHTGRDYTTFETSPYDVFGVLGVLDAGLAFSRFVATSETNTILMLPRAAVLDMAKRDGYFACQLGAAAAQRARLLGELLYARITKPTIARLAAAILPYATKRGSMASALPSLSRMNQVQLARMTGTVKDVVGRDLVQLRSAGAVDLFRGRVISINDSKLQAFL